LASQIALQRGLAAQQAGTYQGFGANQGANYQGFGASQLGTFGLQGQEALRGIAQSGTVKNEPLVSKIAALQAQKGALTATDLGKLQQQQTSNQIAQAGLGIKSAALQNTAAQNQAKNALTARGQNITAADAQGRIKTTAAQNAFNDNPTKVGSAAWSRAQSETGKTFANDPNAVGSAAWARVQVANARSAKSGAGGKGAAGGVKPLTTNENNLANQRIGAIAAAIKTWQQTGVKNSKGQVIEPHPTPAQMRQILAGSYAGPLVEAAFDILGYGSLTSQTAAALHNMGVRNTTYQGKVIPVLNRGTKATGGAISKAGGGGSVGAGINLGAGGNIF
jgi:hypothetical protein